MTEPATRHHMGSPTHASGTIASTPVSVHLPNNSSASHIVRDLFLSRLELRRLFDDPQSTGVVGKVQPLFLSEQRGLFVRRKMELKDSKRLAKACGGRRDEAV